MHQLRSLLQSQTLSSTPVVELAELSGCPDCDGGGWVLVVGEGVKPCQCLVNQKRKRALDRIPSLYRSLRLETIQPNPARHAEQAAVIAAMRQSPESSFVFFGRNGCGKSLFGWLLYRHAVESGRYAVGIPLAELLAEFREWEKNPDRLPTIKPEDLRQSNRRYLVFLDELEKARPSEYAGEMLFRMLDAAFSFEHQLVITSNKTPSELSAHWSEADVTYGPSILRRIMEMSNGVDVRMF